MDSPEQEEIQPKIIYQPSDLTLHSLTPLPTCSTSAILHLTRNRSRLRLKSQPQFKNNLLAGVGYLELANASDFAANVWNQIPVPKHALILMAIGGPVALLMTLVAIYDFRLGLANVRLLLEERRYLHRLRAEYAAKEDSRMVRILDCRLGVSYRETGTEIVDRIAMDGLMGIGSVLVGVGTIMAIWGRYPTVFLTSNLLSGYVGNSMAAIFGLTNALWSGYIIWRFQRFYPVLRNDESTMLGLKIRLQTRFRRFQYHAIINAINGLVAGAASMVTATMWWGYVVLIPCVISLILCNYFWRWKLGYDRPILREQTNPVFNLPVEELEYVSSVQTALAQRHSLPLTIFDPSSLESMIAFIVRNNMFESFVEWIIRDKSVVSALFPPAPDSLSSEEVTLTPEDFVKASPPTESHVILRKTDEFMKEAGLRVFEYRERYLLELVGYAMSLDRKT
ncbi:hypothetical protein PHISCL_04563 [Aspergillus sclerotialis]|uniref:Integral membrane protein n=1 Tax=Aspergillus sclerotialis TaxID=2070753 RepID=A0A3A2ZJ85_9EURO|nr:hypothetical protein PHISCL_04563 [Aspergillus sclerotialis]